MNVGAKETQARFFPRKQIRGTTRWPRRNSRQPVFIDAGGPRNDEGYVRGQIRRSQNETDERGALTANIDYE
jgi:hypothetical protein